MARLIPEMFRATSHTRAAARHGVMLDVLLDHTPHSEPVSLLKLAEDDEEDSPPSAPEPSPPRPRRTTDLYHGPVGEEDRDSKAPKKDDKVLWAKMAPEEEPPPPEPRRKKTPTSRTPVPREPGEESPRRKAVRPPAWAGASMMSRFLRTGQPSDGLRSLSETLRNAGKSLADLFDTARECKLTPEAFRKAKQFRGLSEDERVALMQRYRDSAGQLTFREQKSKLQAIHSGMDDPAMLKLFGAPEGARVEERGEPERSANGGHDFGVSIRHPHFREFNRSVGVDEHGAPYIHVDHTLMKKEHQGGGIGGKMFYRQAKEASRLGFGYLHNHSAGDKYNPSYNGYATWPKFGYDQTVESLEHDNPELASLIKTHYPDAQSVQDVLDTPGGVKWWEDHGSDLPNAVFDLREGSRSQRVLRDYFKDRDIDTSSFAERRRRLQRLAEENDSPPASIPGETRSPGPPSDPLKPTLKVDDAKLVRSHGRDLPGEEELAGARHAPLQDEISQAHLGRPPGDTVYFHKISDDPSAHIEEASSAFLRGLGVHTPRVKAVKADTGGRARQPAVVSDWFNLKTAEDDPLGFSQAVMRDPKTVTRHVAADYMLANTDAHSRNTGVAHGPGGAKRLTTLDYEFAGGGPRMTTPADPHGAAFMANDIANGNNHTFNVYRNFHGHHGPLDRDTLHDAATKGEKLARVFAGYSNLSHMAPHIAHRARVLRILAQEHERPSLLSLQAVADRNRG